ncbi:MAG: glycerophosphodiester phosphodiesterase [Actinobacteria bacterium]|nr:glycerophosphodiester phosphodiesterase [Actinomycetota bacterium]
MGAYPCRVRSSPAFLDHSLPLAFAHRGGALEATENSWAAFSHAVSLGYSYVETDVRVTCDGVPVAFHDPSLERLTGSKGLLRDTDSQKLDRTRLADGSPVPKLEDLLAAWPELRWNIDVKCAEGSGPVLEALRRTKAEPRVLVTAFSARTVGRLRAVLGHGVASGASAWEVAGLLLARHARLKPTWARCSAAQVPVNFKGLRILDAGFVGTCHAAGIQVHAWTVNEPAEMARLLDLGVDGLMTDRPSMLKELLVNSGRWG